MQTLFIIQSQSGKFYNANYKSFYETIPNCVLLKSKKEAELVIASHGLTDVKIEPITEKQFTDELMIHSTDVILSLEIARAYLERLRFNVPLISGANKALANHMKNMSQKLEFISPIFEKCVQENEDLSYHAQGGYEELYKEVAKVPYFRIYALVNLIKNFNEAEKLEVKESEVICQFSEVKSHE